MTQLQVQNDDNQSMTTSSTTKMPMNLGKSELLTLLAPLIKDFNATIIPESKTNHELALEMTSAAESEDPFYVVDIGAIAKKYLQFNALLPRVKIYYAIKCNPHPALIRTIRAMGGCFDCASKGEIATVLNLCPDLNPTTDIIFANPCKQVADMRAARQQGVSMVTFDNEHELIKIRDTWPEVGLVMRIITDDSRSICKFSSKFGVPLHQTTELISKVKQYGLNLIGISFHVGSGCLSVDTFIDTIRSAHAVFEEAKRQGFNMTLLDIGGGFPGTDDAVVTFPEIANAIRPLLDELFPAEDGVQIIAEPGRFFAAASHFLCCNVYAKRTVVPAPVTDASNGDATATTTEKDNEFMYYINDGVYGSFNCLLFDHAVVTPLVVKSTAAGSSTPRISTIFGPTCDSMDTIAKKVPLPEVNVGDWLYFDNFGAYTLAAGSAFNGFKTTKHNYIFRV
eukprot:GEZU01013251.1.p1 GENE.GEZU01013251.1~~GEZU01013251.1.p1  ORF type:complete len:452 (+),score=162.53 GEZU01013251.1:237-1592(+)